MLKKLIATIAVTICCLANPLPVKAQHQIGVYFKDNLKLFDKYSICLFKLLTLYNFPYTTKFCLTVSFFGSSIYGEIKFIL